MKRNRKYRQVEIKIGIFAILTVKLVLFTFMSCAKKMPEYPTTFDAQIIESVDPENVRVRANGLWGNSEGALVEAKMNAMWAVIQTLAQTPEEKAKVEADKKRIFADVERYVTVEGSPKRIRTPEGKIRMEITAVVRKKLLEDSLASAGYIKKREEIIEVLENPSIVIIPDEKAREKEWIAFAVNEANSYFTTKRFEVLNPETLDKLYAMAEQIEALEGLPQDPVAKIALSIGADIYITVEGEAETGRVGSDTTIKSAVSLKAFETTTAKLIGSSTGFSKELVAGPGKDRVTVSEAIRDATDKIITQIMDFWKNDIKKGRQFLIFTYGDFSQLPDQKRVIDSIQAVSTDYKREVGTKNFMSFRIWFKGKSDDLVFALYNEFKKNGFEMEPVSQNRKMLQLRLK